MSDLAHYFADPLTATRRQFLARAGQGFGLVALADLLGQSAAAAAPGAAALNPLGPKSAHFARRRSPSSGCS